LFNQLDSPLDRYSANVMFADEKNPRNGNVTSSNKNKNNDDDKEAAHGVKNDDYQQTKQNHRNNDETENKTKNNDIVEEDWSLSFPATYSQSTTGGFAQHEEHRIQIMDHDTVNDRSMDLVFDCAPCLSPLDMMNLFHGYHDATGHKVWMGAYVFIEGMIRTSSMRSYFSNKRVLELGCGTGVAGLALYFKQSLLSEKGGGGGSDSEDLQSPPSFLTLTDSDSEAIQLCRRNFHKNKARLKTRQNKQEQEPQLSKSITTSSSLTCRRSIPLAIGHLSWGSSLHEAKLDQIVENDNTDDVQNNSSSMMDPYDTVMATDVLYDIESLEPLLYTASACLTSKGYFILSHVPRASLPPTDNDGVTTCHAVATADQLESYIIREASSEKYEFVYCTTIRPYEKKEDYDDSLSRSVDSQIKSLNSTDVSYQDMKDAGAAILIFQKK